MRGHEPIMRTTVAVGHQSRGKSRGKSRAGGSHSALECWLPDEADSGHEGLHEAAHFVRQFAPRDARCSHDRRHAKPHAVLLCRKRGDRVAACEALRERDR